MEALIADLRYAWREPRKRPGFALTAIFSLALGIGATSAVFSVVYAVLIDPFPYPGSERMVSAAEGQGRARPGRGCERPRAATAAAVQVLRERGGDGQLEPDHD